MHPSTKSIIRAAAFCLAALLPAAALNAQGAQGSKPRVAIFEPEENLQKGERSQLTDMQKAIIWGAVQDGLVSTGRYTCLDRTRVQQTMKELNAQRDMNIYDTSGAKAFQARMAADMICHIRVTKDSRGIDIHLSIIDVETGEIENSVHDYKATNQDHEIARMVRELAARLTPKANATSRTAPAAQTQTQAPAPPPPPVSAPARMPAPDVTRDQAIDEVTRYFQKTGKLDSSNRFERNGHKYRIVNDPDAKFFHVAKDRDESWKEFGLSNASSCIGLSIFVTEDEDVYVSGYSTRPGANAGVVWKNGKRLYFGDEVSNHRFDYIWVWGGDDVFAVLRPASGDEATKSRGASLYLNGDVLASRQ